MAEVLADRYELRGLLGSGGMARVYEGFDRVLQRAVAVKVLRDDLGVGRVERERLIREARSAASFSHPNAVAVFDTGQHDGQPFIVMELVEGRSLDEVLRDGPLEPGRAVDIAGGFLDALAAAHGVGLVHRDVKPSNILLPDTGGVKLADFGIAKAMADASATLTATGQIIGTPRYLSPEQVEGRPADPRSDVYASGVVLYEMLAGRAPFAEATPLATLLAHQREDPPPLDEQRAGLDPHLVAIVHRCLAKEPDQRFADAAELRAALLGGVPAGAEATTMPIGAGATTAVLDAPSDVEARPRRWRSAAIVAALGLLALLAFTALRPDDPTVVADDGEEGATPVEQEPAPAGPDDGAGEPAPATAEPEADPEPDTIAALITSLAEDPDAAGEKGEDLFDLLVDVSRMEADKQPKEAREAIKKIDDWAGKGELDAETGALAISLLEPMAAEPDDDDDDDGEEVGPPPGRGEGRGEGAGRGAGRERG